MNLVVENLSKHFITPRDQAELKVLKDISFEVDKGEFVSIVGPSGCGKTTLLEIIAGLQPATSGLIRTNGGPIDESPARRSIVFQQYALFPWMNVQRNVEYGPRIKKFSKKKRREISAKFIEMVGLKEFKKFYPHELSGGMQQRVALARALANNPDILLLDEPFAALDAQTKEICQRELLMLWQQTALTVIFVTHDVGEAIFLSDKVIVLSACPATIIETFYVPLQRPRNYDTRLSNEFNKLDLSIRSRLNNKNSNMKTILNNETTKIGSEISG